MVMGGLYQLRQTQGVNDNRTLLPATRVFQLGLIPSMVGDPDPLFRIKQWRSGRYDNHLGPVQRPHNDLPIPKHTWAELERRVLERFPIRMHHIRR
jgi:hypothetical protein